MGGGGFWGSRVPPGSRKCLFERPNTYGQMLRLSSLFNKAGLGDPKPSLSYAAVGPVCWRTVLFVRTQKRSTETFNNQTSHSRWLPFPEPGSVGSGVFMVKIISPSSLEPCFT